MRIAIDFDNTLVRQDHPYDDLKTPLASLPGAKSGVYSLRHAGHVLILWSARSSLALRKDPSLDALVKAGVVALDVEAWKKKQPLHQARYSQMVTFVHRNLPGAFAWIADGTEAGKMPGIDLYIDDKAFGCNGIVDWPAIVSRYGKA